MQLEFILDVLESSMIIVMAIILQLMIRCGDHCSPRILSSPVLCFKG